MPRYRSRSDSRDRHHRRSKYEERDRGGGGRRHHHDDRDHRRDRRYDDRRDRRRDEEEDDLRTPSFDEKNCVRIGVENPRRPLSKQQLIDEIEQVKLAHRVVHCHIEPPSGGYEWGRVYFKTFEDADDCITELNIPLRQSKWRNYVTQRLPLPGPHSGEMGTIPAFQPCVQEPADTLVVDTQEGFVHFSTDELYRTKGSDEYMTARSVGKIIRRLICKHFDPEARISCRYGADCQFVHIKAEAMNRLLRTTHHRSGLRASRNDEIIQVSLWEFARRRDTLLIRNLDSDLDDAGLKYMFETCPGFKECFLRRKDHQSYGIIRFDCEKSAMMALLQTYGSNLNIAFFGPMEDIRTMQLQEAKESGNLTNYNRSFFNNRGYHHDDRDKGRSDAKPSTTAASGEAQKQPATATTNASPSARAAAATKEPTFPPLPEGWSHGLSRRTGQYFFYHKNEKNKTTWKHPETQQTYKM